MWLAHMLAAGRHAALRNGVEAVSVAEQAVKGAGDKDPVSLDVLAMAYAEAGRLCRRHARRRRPYKSQSRPDDLVMRRQK